MEWTFSPPGGNHTCKPSTTATTGECLGWQCFQWGNSFVSIQESFPNTQCMVMYGILNVWDWNLLVFVPVHAVVYTSLFPCFETFGVLGIRQFSHWFQKNSVKSRTFPMNSINEIHEAGLGRYGCDSKFRNPLWSLKGEICLLKVLIYFDLLQETDCAYKGALKFQMGDSTFTLGGDFGAWWDMIRHVDMRLCFSNEKSSLRPEIVFVFFANVH